MQVIVDVCEYTTTAYRCSSSRFTKNVKMAMRVEWGSLAEHNIRTEVLRGLQDAIYMHSSVLDCRSQSLTPRI